MPHLSAVGIPFLKEGEDVNTIAVGAVIADSTHYCDAEDVASSAAAAKKLAKQSQDGFHLMTE